MHTQKKSLSGQIAIEAHTSDNVYGMYGNGDIHNADYNVKLKVCEKDKKKKNTTANVIGNIVVNNTGSGAVYGMYNDSSSGTVYNEKKTDFVEEEDGETTYTASIQTESFVDVTNSNGGDAYGLYSKGFVVNSGTLYSTATSGTAYGIAFGGTLTNSSNVTVQSKANAYGVYGFSGSSGSTNTGTIKSSSTVEGNAYGVYLEDSSDMTNTGNIKVTAKKGDAYGVYAQNSSFTHSGNLQPDSLVVETKKGDAYGIRAEGESSKIINTSNSDVTDNKDVAEFLEKNYALSNNEELFSTLKQNTNLSGLNENIQEFMGQGLTRFAFEDMTNIKELDFEINEQILQNKDSVFHLSGSSAPVFLENNIGSHTSWGVNGVQNKNSSFGIGMAFSNIQSLDSHNQNDRFDQMFQIFMPMSFKTQGVTLLMTPRAGYAYGTYERDGYQGTTYDGKIEKRILGLTSSASYPMKKNGFTIAPTTELNAIGYRLKGHEDDKKFALNIEKQNVVSLEAGVGLHLNFSRDFSKTSHFKMNNSLMLYHEFANPYEMELSMNGMDGTYRLRDEKRRDERIAVRNSLEYDTGALSFYSNLFSYIDSEYRIKADVGLRYAF